MTIVKRKIPSISEGEELKLSILILRLENMMAILFRMPI
jgi:hypothetical protein